MKHFLSIFSFLIVIAVNAQDWAQLDRYKKANLTLDLDTVDMVFMGDSITEGWSQFRPSFFTNGFVCRGIGGQTTPQMLLRFRQDVINLAPKKVILLAGINDIAQNTGPITLDQIMDNIKSMTEMAKANNIEMILCSLLPANSFPWRLEITPTQKVIQLNQMIKTYAEENKLYYVDYYAAMVDESKGLQQQLGYDTVHPNAAGYQVMEQVLMEEIKAIHGH